MKKKVLKYYIVTICLFSNLIIFAQVDTGPGNEGNGAGGGPEGVAAPINDYIWVLLVLGFVFAFYKIKTFIFQNKI
jgi:hypothetical protein